MIEPLTKLRLNDIEYSLSPIVKTAVLPKALYIKTSSGNDDTGDGSSVSPFKTVDRAIQEAELRGEPGFYYIFNEAGEYHIKINNFYNVVMTFRCNVPGIEIIFDEMDVYTEEHMQTSARGIFNSYIQIFGYGIEQNTKLKFMNNAEDITGIVTWETTFINSKIRLENLDVSGSNNRTLFVLNSSSLLATNCRFNLPLCNYQSNMILNTCTMIGNSSVKSNIGVIHQYNASTLFLVDVTFDMTSTYNNDRVLYSSNSECFLRGNLTVKNSTNIKKDFLYFTGSHISGDVDTIKKYISSALKATLYKNVICGVYSDNGVNWDTPVYPYKTGDSLNLSNLVFSGFVSSAGESIYVSIPLDRPTTSSSIKLTKATFTVRGLQGYVDSNSSGINFLASGFRNTILVSNGTIRLAFYRDGKAFENVLNNTPVSLLANDLQFSFT